MKRIILVLAISTWYIGAMEERPTKKARIEEVKLTKEAPKLIIIAVQGEKKILPHSLYSLSPILVQYAKFPAKARSPFTALNINKKTFELLYRLLLAERHITDKNMHVIKSYAQQYGLSLEELVAKLEQAQFDEAIQTILVELIKQHPDIEELINELLQVADHLQLKNIVHACAKIIGKQVSTVHEITTAKTWPSQIQKIMMLAVVPTQENIHSLLEWVNHAMLHWALKPHAVQKSLVPQLIELFINNFTQLSSNQVLTQFLNKGYLINILLKQHIMDEYWPLLLKKEKQITRTPDEELGMQWNDPINSLQLVKDNLLIRSQGAQYQILKALTLKTVGEIEFEDVDAEIPTLDEEKPILYVMDNIEGQLEIWDLNRKPIKEMKQISIPELQDHAFRRLLSLKEIIMGQGYLKGDLLESMLYIIDKQTLKIKKMIDLKEELQKQNITTFVSEKLQKINDQYVLINFGYSESPTTSKLLYGVALFDIANLLLVSLQKNNIRAIPLGDKQNIVIIKDNKKAFKMSIQEFIRALQEQEALDSEKYITLPAIYKSDIAPSVSSYAIAGKFLMVNTGSTIEIFDIHANKRISSIVVSMPKNSLFVDMAIGRKMLITSIFHNPIAPSLKELTDYDRWRDEQDHWQNERYILELLQFDTTLNLLERLRILAQKYAKRVMPTDITIPISKL